MHSTSSSTSRTRRIARRAIIAAAAAGIAAGSAAAAPAAFAGGTPGPIGQYTGTVLVASTLTIQPQQNAFTMNAVPGTTTSTVPFTITCGSSDSAGYSLVESLVTQFGSIPDTSWSTDTYAFSNGAFVTTPVTYDAAGDVVTLFATGQLSGHTGVSSSGSPVYSPVANFVPVGTDVVTTTVHLALPAGFPGSPSTGYAGAFNYQIIGA